MSDWWTYRLSDFLLFSARTYRRLFELYNAEVWPLHLVALALGLALLALLAVSARGGSAAARAACALLAACWLWVAWAFHLQRYATINWAAAGFAVAFALEGVLLIGAVGARLRLRLRGGHGLASAVGLGLLFVAVVGQPLIGRALGRPWTQAEVFGLAPDPTVVGTLGLLVLLRPGDGAGAAASTRAFVLALWPIPLLWCLVGGATLWAMDAPEAVLMPCVGLLAVFVALRARR